MTSRLRRLVSSSRIARSVSWSSREIACLRRPAPAFAMIASGLRTSCAMTAASSPTTASCSFLTSSSCVAAQVLVRPPELARSVPELLRAALELLRHGGVTGARGGRDPDDERRQAQVGQVDRGERAARDADVVDHRREQDGRAEDDREGAALTDEIGARHEDEDDGRRAEDRDVRRRAVWREGSHDAFVPQRPRRRSVRRRSEPPGVVKLEPREDRAGAVGRHQPSEARPTASGVDEREVHRDGQGREKAHDPDATRRGPSPLRLGPQEPRRRGTPLVCANAARQNSAASPYSRSAGRRTNAMAKSRAPKSSVASVAARTVASTSTVSGAYQS